MATSSPLAQCTVLKMICDHPRRMSTNACIAAGLIDGHVAINDGDKCAANDIDDVDLNVLLSESGKMRVLTNLLDALLPDKILIFSHSIKILDIIAKLLAEKGIRNLRVDGTVIQSARTEKYNLFRDDDTVKVLLMTTGVGSVGLTLTAATRVIIYDPSWNPGCDDQAAARAHRIGQNMPVVVFRLITCETIEEKIYNLQLFKKSIISQNNGEDDNPERMFSSNDIKSFFISPKSASHEMFSGKND